MYGELLSPYKNRHFGFFYAPMKQQKITFNSYNLIPDIILI